MQRASRQDPQIQSMGNMGTQSSAWKLQHVLGNTADLQHAGVAQPLTVLTLLAPDHMKSNATGYAGQIAVPSYLPWQLCREQQHVQGSITGPPWWLCWQQ